MNREAPRSTFLPLVALLLLALAPAGASHAESVDSSGLGTGWTGSDPARAPGTTVRPMDGLEPSVRIYRARDPEAPVVTPQNLLESERFWPYRVQLTKAFAVPGRDRPLPVDTTAVLVRVEPSGTARVDFGRYGIAEVPVDHLDVVAAANRIRTGEEEKKGPNFSFAIGPRLVDTAADVPRELSLHETYDTPGYLAVYADPTDFEALAGALRPLSGRRGVVTVLFPRSSEPDPVIRQRLREIEWPVPFAIDNYAEAYTRSLLGSDALPAVQLQTAEGRVLLERPFGPGVVSALTAAIDAGFPDDPRPDEIR